MSGGRRSPSGRSKSQDRERDRSRSRSPSSRDGNRDRDRDRDRSRSRNPSRLQNSDTEGLKERGDATQRQLFGIGGDPATAERARVQDAERHNNRSPITGVQATRGRRGLDDLAKPRIQSLGKEGSDLVMKQDAIMAELSRIIDQNRLQGEVFRLSSISIKKENGGLTFRLTQPQLAIPQGLSALPIQLIEQNGELMNALLENVIHTMKISGQLDYITQTDLNAEGAEIIVDVDFYKNRPPSNIGFHKDTTGYTLFVNLNFNNKEQIVGPEYILNPAPIAVHDSVIAQTLPREFLLDLQAQRERLGQPELIDTAPVPPNGVVSFVDEIIHHTTPLLARRTLSQGEFQGYLNSINPISVKQLFKKAYPKRYNLAYNTSTKKVNGRQDLENAGFTAEEINAIFQNLRQQQRSLSNEELTSFELRRFLEERERNTISNLTGLQAREQVFIDDLLQAGLPMEEIKKLFPPFSNVNLSGTVGSRPLDSESTGLRRKMSGVIQQGIELPNPDAPRSFFRTWVQVVPPGTQFAAPNGPVYAQKTIRPL